MKQCKISIHPGSSPDVLITTFEKQTHQKFIFHWLIHRIIVILHFFFSLSLLHCMAMLSQRPSQSPETNKKKSEKLLEDSHVALFLCQQRPHSTVALPPGINLHKSTLQDPRPLPNQRKKKAASIINIWVFFIQHQNNWTNVGLVIYIQNSIFISPPWQEKNVEKEKKCGMQNNFKIPRICVTFFSSVKR